MAGNHHRPVPAPQGVRQLAVGAIASVCAIGIAITVLAHLILFVTLLVVAMVLLAFTKLWSKR